MMQAQFRSALAFFFALAMVLIAPNVFAQAKGPVHVVNLDSDDATEDQADGLTAALKSKVRGTPGWQMAESTDSLSMLIPALKCPPKPDAGCLARIGDQLKTDRFFWGSVTKAAAPHQVTAEVHLWLRGKPEQSVKESYTENLKDQNDEALKKMASRIFERLSGAGTEGSVTIHCAVESAQVFVDGQPKGTLTAGVSSLTLPAGTHAIELRADGYAPQGQEVSIITGTESSITIELKKGSAPPPNGVVPTEPSKPVPVMKIVGISAMGAGVVLGVIGAIEGVRFLGLRSSNNDDHNNVLLKGISDFCRPPQGVGDPVLSQAACDRKTSAEGALVLESVFLGIGGALFIAGTIILLTDRGPAEKKSDTPASTTWRVTPSFGPKSGGFTLAATF